MFSGSEMLRVLLRDVWYAGYVSHWHVSLSCFSSRSRLLHGKSREVMSQMSNSFLQLAQLFGEAEGPVWVFL